MATERSPGFKLFFAGLIALILVAPLMMVYALVWAALSGALLNLTAAMLPALPVICMAMSGASP